MRLLFFTFILTFSLFANGQNLYINTYGNEKNTPIIFIHDGPSGNATLFEGTTAQTLADKGFYVIAYDRRGEGRSSDPNAKFTYEEAFQDLNFIYTRYHLKKAILLGHSFGGLVATLYTNKYPQHVSSLVLAGALFSQQETYDHILNSVSKIATSQGDSMQLIKIKAIKKLNKNTAEYRKGCFDLASDHNYFKMPQPTKEFERLSDLYKSGKFFKTNIRNKNAPLLFYQNEKANNIDTRPILKKIKAKGVRLYGIYGKQDGIFSPAQIKSIQELVGTEHFVLLNNCSHYLFVDQQTEFIAQLKDWLNNL